MSWFVSSHCDAVISTWFHLDLKKKKRRKRKKTKCNYYKARGKTGRERHWRAPCTAKKNPKNQALGTLVNGSEACLCDAMINVNSRVNIQQVISLSLLNSSDCLFYLKWINTPIRVESDMQIKEMRLLLDHAVTESRLLSHIRQLWVLAAALPLPPLLPFSQCLPLSLPPSLPPSTTKQTKTKLTKSLVV